jgi:hypothetical protein
MATRLRTARCRARCGGTTAGESSRPTLLFDSSVEAEFAQKSGHAAAPTGEVRSLRAVAAPSCGRFGAPAGTIKRGLPFVGPLAYPTPIPSERQLECGRT